MKNLFDTYTIADLTLRNRFVRSATWEGMASADGAVTPNLISTMTDLARGGPGLIISSHAYVSKEGQAGPWQLGIDRDECIDGLKEMTSAVHGEGGKIMAQLAHAGRFAVSNISGKTPLTVSEFDGGDGISRHEITGDDIERLIGAFTEAALRAKKVGFDGVELHSAHGYLLSQFLTPQFNRRDDQWGGTIGNRCRIHTEIIRSIKAEAGNDFPVFVKINCRDFIEDGLEETESIEIVKIIAAAGADAIELSGGTFLSGELSPSRRGINKPEKEAYFREEAQAIKKVINIPLILVGGMRSIELAQSLIDDGTADAVSLSRPFIREPDLIARWQRGDTEKAECISCNKCFGPPFQGEGIYCVVKKD